MFAEQFYKQTGDDKMNIDLYEGEFFEMVTDQGDYFHIDVKERNAEEMDSMGLKSNVDFKWELHCKSREGFC